jgi:hypothetical protein
MCRYSLPDHEQALAAGWNSNMLIKMAYLSWPNKEPRKTFPVHLKLIRMWNSAKLHSLLNCTLSHTYIYCIKWHYISLCNTRTRRQCKCARKKIKWEIHSREISLSCLYYSSSLCLSTWDFSGNEWRWKRFFSQGRPVWRHRAPQSRSRRYLGDADFNPINIYVPETWGTTQTAVLRLNPCFWTIFW